MIIRGRILEIEGHKYLFSGLQYFRLSGSNLDMFDLAELEGKMDDAVFNVARETLLTKGALTPGNQNWKRAIYDRDFKARMIKSQLMYAQVRSYLWEEGFLEINTPVMSRYAAMEPTMDSFGTTFREEDLYLHTSPEYFMKKALVSGIADNIFQICPVFRMDMPGKLHNPEFMMLEWYRSYEPYETLMDDCLNLVRKLAGSNAVEYKGGTISLDSYEKITVEEAFKKYAGTDFNEIGVHEERKGWKDLFFTILMNDVEPNLGFERPVVLYEYPAAMAALSKRKEDDPRVAKRFEFYMAGIELANCFEELTDPVEQEKRFTVEKTLRQESGKTVYEIDDTFIDALKTGMPPASGGALGLDRMFMILSGSDELKETMMFPYKDV